MTATENDETNANPETKSRGLCELIEKYKSPIGLGILGLYLFLLTLGTIGEVWDVEWILDLPLFRPPGKY